MSRNFSSFFTYLTCEEIKNENYKVTPIYKFAAQELLNFSSFAPAKRIAQLYFRSSQIFSFFLGGWGKQNLLSLTSSSYILQFVKIVMILELSHEVADTCHKIIILHCSLPLNASIYLLAEPKHDAFAFISIPSLFLAKWMTSNACTKFQA